MDVLLYGIVLVALAFVGAPLFSIIGAIALLAFTAAGIDTSAVIVELYRLASAPTLIAIPLFTFAGYVLAESKTPRRLVDLSHGTMSGVRSARRHGRSPCRFSSSAASTGGSSRPPRPPR